MKSAIYAGSFDPITNGHIDVIEKASKIFDHIVIAVGDNSSKKHLFEIGDRGQMISGSLHESGIDFSISNFGGLLVNYAKSKEIDVIIRGLRTVSDFEHEFQMLKTNRKLCPDIETIFIMPDSDCEFISSSTVKEIRRHGGNLDGFVSKYVEEYWNKFDNARADI